MVFNQGDFILVEYSIRVKETGTLLDTTDEELAKKENIYEADRLYGPTLVVLGRGWMNEVVEQELMKMEVNEEKEVEVPPEKAFGERDSGKVRTFSLKEFQRRGYSVNVGDVVEVGGVKGVVKSISGGRVVVDFNHPLAGRTLVYKVKVVGKLEEFKEKVKALASRHLNIAGSDIDVAYEEAEKKLVVSIPGKYLSRRELNYSKISLATDIFDMFKDAVEKLVFQETLSKTQAQTG
ncbi:FKBP-type peptidyl-prolyl cis-trans isomerase [Thermosphaera chiliense]|uniref:Peptidyl-prolyl cis-trans isomerase n=1 Tax=Thermosphaera chiliense TaxID=3402707 RepID=A0A7M1UTQ4_9CREN|nr:FKBP-type peptidyl-prolyl cis-trans isomerase [Thermosphaera aggregans]QOR94602.1 FKBP-type peptidyl-prolyl cis-trans isomerase [Thermosphaera aggregans]